MLGGLLGAYGPRAPFVAAAILAALNFTAGYFVLPETVTDKTRRPFEAARANPFGAIRQVKKLPGLGRLLVVYFFSSVGFMVYPAVWSYYTQEKFGWSEWLVGLSLGAFGISIAISQGLLIRVFIKRLGERKTVMFAYSINVLAFILYGLAWEGWMIFAFITLTSLGIMGTPSLHGIMSRRVNDNAQGELQGVLTSVTAIASIISPLVMGKIFGYFTAPDAPIYLPGAPFFLSAVLAFISILIFMRTKVQT
jgi:DHA1 family tetracycline resistance protein-like MFS transporter